MAVQILVAVAFLAALAIAGLLVVGGLGNAVADRRPGGNRDRDPVPGDPGTTASPDEHAESTPATRNERGEER